jgi:hypothetical protein
MSEIEYTMRYDFAMSSFARMYGVPRVNSSEPIHRFCRKWAKTEDQIDPLYSLTEVDFYFKDLWDIWGGYV